MWRFLNIVARNVKAGGELGWIRRQHLELDSMSASPIGDFCNSATSLNHYSEDASEVEFSLSCQYATRLASDICEQEISG